jgi:flagellin
MSLVINTNVASLNAQRSLTASGAELKTAMERLSSGKKINSASDDAAGFAIAERMTAQIRGLNMAAKNASDGLSMLATIENATNDITGMLHRMRELAVQGINDTNGTQDRAYLQLEVDALMEEINRVASDTQYNGKSVLNGSMANTVDSSGNITAYGGQIQVGTDANQTVGFGVNSVDTVALNLSAAGTAENHSTAAKEFVAGTSQIDVSSATNASTSLAKISAAIEQVAGDRAGYGALQNRLEYTVSNLLNVAEYTTAARSRIEDADFAAESARLAKAQVLQQSGTAMLAQANASSQLALSLFR